MRDPQPAGPETRANPPTPKTRSLLARASLGGILMGLANLVPGISGGTMLLASGIYPRFIQAVAEVTTLKFRRTSLLVLGTVAGTAILAILLLAGGVRDLVVHHRWIMYSLFIGLTLGGIPVVWKLARPVTTSVWAGAAAGLLVMVVLALAQGQGSGPANEREHLILMFMAGLAGASAMILPGVSGGYILLVMGVYIPILSAVDAFKDAIGEGSLHLLIDPTLRVLIPVGIGLVLGIAGVSTLLRWLLREHAKPTLGFLLGLLVGAVIGLWPFQQTVPPVVGETIIKGQLVTEDNLGRFGEEDWPTARFRPSPGQAVGAIALIGAGIAITAGVARLGREEGDQR